MRKTRVADGMAGAGCQRGRGRGVIGQATGHGGLPVRPQRSESRVLARPQIWSCVSSSGIQRSGEAMTLVSHLVGPGRAVGTGASHDGGSRARRASDLSSTSAGGLVCSPGRSSSSSSSGSGGSGSRPGPRSGWPARKLSTLSAGAIACCLWSGNGTRQIADQTLFRWTVHASPDRCE